MKKIISLLLVFCLLLSLGVGAMPVQAVEEATETPTAKEAPAPAVSQEVSAQPIQPEPTEPELEEPVGNIRVNLGTTKALTGEVGMLGTASANALTASGVTWTSSNPAVATVDQSGVVTAVDLGQAIITATKNGTVIETYTVISTFEDGEVCFESFSTSTDTISVERLSVKNGTGLRALPYNYDDETLLTFGDRWYFENISGTSYYTIRPSYNLDMVLCMLNGTTVCIYDESSLTNDCWKWSIEGPRSSFSLVNVEYSNKTIALEDTEEEVRSLVVANYNSSNNNQKFHAYEPVPFVTMFLFNTKNGNHLANSEMEYGVLPEIRLGQNFSNTLDDFNLLIRIASPTPLSQDYSLTLSSNIATYNVLNKKLTGVLIDSATESFQKAVGSTVYSLDFTLKVLPSSSVVAYYDNATFTPQWRTYLPGIADFYNDVFREEVGYYFGKDDTPTAYNSSLLAACPNGVTSQCDSTCGYSTSCRTTHHKNLGRLTAEISAGNTTSTFMYWRGDSPTVFCGSRGPDFEYDPMHVHTALDEGMQGVVYDNQNVAFFFETPETVPEKIRANLALTAAHELAHTLGLREVYSNEYGDNSNHDVKDGLACVMEAFEPGDYEKDFYEDVIADEDTAFCNYCIGKLAAEIQS